MADTESTDIKATPERVWQELGNASRWAVWMNQITRSELEEGDTLQSGSKVKVTTEDSDRRNVLNPRGESHHTWQVSEVKPGELIRIGEPPNDHVYRIEAIPGGTRVTYQSGTAARLLALVAPIVSFFGGVQAKLDLHSLRVECEKQ